MRRALGLIALLAAPPVAAQDAEIVVVGQGLAPPAGDAAFPIAEIDRAAIEGSASGRLEDVLAGVAGVAQFRRSDARSANPTSQGITLRGLGGNAASRALLVLDGVPQADPFGGWVAFPAYAPSRIGQVRVTRGGGSGYAGPGALAGTIALTTDMTAGFDASALGGSRDSLDLALRGAARLGPGGVMAAASYARGDGFAPIVARARGPVDGPAPYEQASASLRGVVDIGRATELQASLLAFTDRRTRGTAFTANKSEGADASVRVVGRGAWGWSALGYVQTRGFASQFASVNDARTTVAPALDQYNTPATGIGGRVEIAPPIGGGVALRLGGDLRHVEGRTQERYFFAAGVPSRRREAGGTSLTAGLLADASIERGTVIATLGLRADRWRIGTGQLVEVPLAGGVPFTDARFAPRSGWEGTGRVGVAWRAGPAVTLRAAAYRGWRLPTLNELYRPFRVGADATAANPDLAPERLTGFEGGVDLATGPLALSATLFRNRLEGAIPNVTLGVGPGNFPGAGFVAAGGTYRQRRNLDAVAVTGAEIDARLRLGAWFAAASYAFTDARVAATGAALPLDGQRPAQTARHQASFSAGWRADAGAVTLTTRYVGPQFEDDLGQRALAGALTVDAVAELALGSGIALTVRGENLFDREVQAGISGAGVVERASPRTLWLGLRYRLR